MPDKKDEVLKALYKRAGGYVAEESVEEYAVKEGGEELVRRKVTYKDVPPDISAIKLLLDGEEDSAEFTEAELIAEKERLIKLLLAGEYVRGNSG